MQFLSKAIFTTLLPFILAASAQAAVDLASPKSVAKSFYEAMSNADGAAMRDCLLINGENEQQLATAFVDVILAGKKLGDAAKDKFGPSGDKIAAGALPREEASAIDNAQQTDNGGNSTLKVTAQSRPLKFHKTDTGWKLVLLDLAGSKSDNVPEQIKVLQSLAAAMNDTSDDIAAGRYPTSADAEAAIQQRLSEVTVKRYKPATTQAR
jgi:hypothetical protein